MADFGRDISCTSSIMTGRYATGVRLVAEACYRRLITPRGMLRGGEEEANYGLDLSELVGSTSTKNDEAALAGRIRAELEKDERVETADVKVTRVESKDRTVSFGVVVAATTAEGPFTLTLAVTDVSVELLGIEAAA